MKRPIGLGVVVVFLTESSYTCVLVFCAQDWLSDEMGFLLLAGADRSPARYFAEG